MAKQTKSGAVSPARTVISPKDAVITATKHFTEVTGITSGVTVEELELTEDGKYWMVTLGYADPGKFIPTLGGARAYKLFKVNALTAKVISMKIRTL